jgi:hypothetical protein
MPSAAKAKAKQDRELAKKQSIGRAAQFEAADLIEENDVDATPRPMFTPRPRKQFPAESSDVEMAEGSDFDGADFKPPTADGSVTEDDSTFESCPRSPSQRRRRRCCGTKLILPPKNLKRPRGRSSVR